MRSIVAVIKILLFAMVTIVVIPVQLLVLSLCRGKESYIIPWLWHKSVCIIFRIKVKVIGTPYADSQAIYVSNHISYLDIPVIGSVIRGSFVAKKDVESWPVFGFLSKLQQTAFISRDRKDAKKEKNSLDSMLKDKKSLIMFPEGTSTDGVCVLPFKSSLFSIAFRDGLNDIIIQPITLNMELVDNKKIINQADRDIYSWHINMDTPLEKHLWRFALSHGAIISLNFHSIIKTNDVKDRKTLAKLCYNTVSNGLKLPTNSEGKNS